MKMYGSPVLSLLIIDANTLVNGEITSATKVAACVRHPLTNCVHPNTVSTPTQRLPYSIFNDIYDNVSSTLMKVTPMEDFPESITRVYSLYEFPKKLLVNNKSHDSLTYAVMGILKGKLNLAEALDFRKIKCTVGSVLLMDGIAINEELTGHSSERLDMLTVRVDMEGATELAANSCAYSSIKFITVQEFIDMVERRDVSHLEKYFENAIQYCVKGLCTISSYIYLKKGKNK